ncbi:MAG: hypothetical protein KJ060_21305 [Candidatus Hydrogenedentes bacterium]|nr:hypothetical protein [Candidatus Hydrogenedentota bacterium]
MNLLHYMNRLLGQLSGFSALVLALAVCCYVFSTHAGSDWSKNWRKLGSATVTFSKDRDELRCAGKGFVRQIVFEVRNTAVNFDDIKVHLVNGTVLDVRVRAVVRAGERSRIIDLPGEARLINKIVFRYRSVGTSSKGRAVVVVWGNKP